MGRNAIAVTAALLVLAACAAQEEPRREPLEIAGVFTLAFDLRQHTTPGAGGDLDPTLSPDGVHLAFSSLRDGPRHNLYVKNLQVPRVWRLTSFAASDRFPEFSPDGKWLAFASDRDGNWDIWLAPALRGGPLRQLTLSLDDEIRPTWSPDGKRLAYSSRNRHGHWSVRVWEVEADRHLLVGPGLFPSWSPDGKEVVFQKIHPTRRGWSTLWTYAFDNDQASELYSNPRFSALFPSWSPNGRQIAFGVRAPGNEDWWDPRATSLWLMERDGRPPLMLHQSTPFVGAPVWAHDGRIYFPSMADGLYSIWSCAIKKSVERPAGAPTAAPGPAPAGPPKAAPEAGKAAPAPAKKPGPEPKGGPSPAGGKP